MEAQTVSKQMKESSSELKMPETDYPQEDIVNLRLPRKRVALLDVEANFSTLPTRTPYVAAKTEAEDAA